MVLGDNIFYGNGFGRTLRAAVKEAEENNNATVFGYYVTDPERFGVVEFDEMARLFPLKKNLPSPRVITQ